MTSFFFGVVATLALVLANAFFVASEFALVKFRPTQLQALVARGNRRAALALRMNRKIDVYLSANQLGITLASIALGWVGEPTFARVFETFAGGAGGWSEAAAHSVAVAVSFALITVFHVVLGELAPKSIAIQRTEAVALWTAAPLHVFYIATFPFIWLLNALSGLALRVVGLRPAEEGEDVQTPEELRLILRHVRLDSGARRLMDRLVDYTKRVVRHVMTLRADLVVLDAHGSFEENMRVAIDSQYTRFLLVDSGAACVVGYVHVKDIATALASGGRPASMDALARAPLSVDEAMPLDALRREILRTGVPIAVVNDAQGNWTGAVTLEDLLEEFVGEIRDEYDAAEVPPIVRARDGMHFEVDGRLTLDVLERELGVRVPDVPEGVETIGGYTRRHIARAVQVGDTVEVGGVRLVVLEVRQRRVARLRGERFEPGPPVERSTVVSEAVAHPAGSTKSSDNERLRH